MAGEQQNTDQVVRACLPLIEHWTSLNVLTKGPGKSWQWMVRQLAALSHTSDLHSLKRCKPMLSPPLLRWKWGRGSPLEFHLWFHFPFVFLFFFFLGRLENEIGRPPPPSSYGRGASRSTRLDFVGTGRIAHAQLREEKSNRHTAGARRAKKSKRVEPFCPWLSCISLPTS